MQKMQVLRFLSGILVCLAIATPLNSYAQAYGSGWYGELQFSYGREDNISHTYKSADRVDDLVAGITVGGGYSQKLGPSGQLIFSGYVTANRHQDYDALNNVATSIGADYIFQPNAGYSAVWYNFTVNATNLEYEDSDPREGVLVDVDLGIHKRLSTRITGRAGYRYHNFFFVGKSGAEEKNDAAFERQADELYIGADLELTPSIYLFGEYTYREGDTVSTITPATGPSTTTGAVFHTYPAETIDTIFDPPCTRRCLFSYAYRQNSTVHLLDLGVAFPIKMLNFDVAASYVRGEGDVNHKIYDNWMVKIGAIWSF